MIGGRMSRNPLVSWILGATLAMAQAAPEYQRKRDTYRGGKATSKCNHGPRGKAGDKIARLAAEHRLGMPSGRPI